MNIKRRKKKWAKNKRMTCRWRRVQFTECTKQTQQQQHKRTQSSEFKVKVKRREPKKKCVAHKLQWTKRTKQNKTRIFAQLRRNKCAFVCVMRRTEIRKTAHTQTASREISYFWPTAKTAKTTTTEEQNQRMNDTENASERKQTKCTRDSAKTRRSHMHTTKLTQFSHR